MASEREDEEREDAAAEGDASSTPSDVDAMGRDKRRGVVGGQYGATVRKQLTIYGIFVAVVILAIIGGLTVVSSIDNRDRELVETGPWTEAGASQSEPRPLDFIANGPCNTIPREQIGKAPGPDDDAANNCD